MIKINKEYLFQNLNTIIKEKRNYGKKNIGNENKVLILTYVPNLNDINEKVLVFIDNLSRIYYDLGYIPSKEVLITNYDVNNIYNIKNKLDRYRIKINKFISLDNLYEEGIVDEVLLKYQYTNNCYIKENSLFLKMGYDKEIKLIDEYGNYSSLLYLLSYNYNNSLKYKKIITILPSNNNYNIELLSSALNILHKENLFIYKEIDNKKDIKGEDINLTRYTLSKDNVSLDIYNLLDDTEKRLFDILYRKKIELVDKYNTLDDDISYNILNKLYEFNNIITSSLERTITSNITNYIEELVILLNSYLNKNSTYTKEKINFLYASKIVLDNALDLIGIIPNY